MRLRLHRSLLLSLGVAVAFVALAGLEGCASPAPDEAPPNGGGAEEGTNAQVADVTDSLATIEGDAAAGTRIAVVRSTRFVLEGTRIGELVIGKRYALELRKTDAAPRNGLAVRELVDFRAVKHVIGTLADDANDPAGMILTSVHGKSYALYGDAATAYKEIRASLPAHDYAKTLFEANVVPDKRPSTRFEWLDYAPVPHVRCTQKDEPGVHLDLVDVKPDESMLDGFVTIPMSTHESRVGAHAECKRDPAGALAYACALDVLGEAWGKATFVPSAATPFDLTVERTDATELVFACEVLKPETLLAASED